MGFFGSARDDMKGYRYMLTVFILGLTAISLGSGLNALLDDKLEDKNIWHPHNTSFALLTLLELFNTVLNAAKAIKITGDYFRGHNPEKTSLLNNAEKPVQKNLADAAGSISASCSSTIAAIALTSAMSGFDTIASHNNILFSVATGLLAFARVCGVISEAKNNNLTAGQIALKVGDKVVLDALAFMSLATGLNGQYIGLNPAVSGGFITAGGAGWVTEAVKETGKKVVASCVSKTSNPGKDEENDVNGSPASSNDSLPTFNK